MKTLDRLRAENKKLRNKLKRLANQREETQQALHASEDAIRRETLRQAIGQPVKRRYRSSKHPLLNDAIGTLTSVRRTRCTVKYSEPIHGCDTWTMPIDGVCLAQDEQGETVEYMLGGGKQ